MTDDRIQARIAELVREEHTLRQSVQRRELSSAEEQVRLARVEETLDQCWDLLRQRGARRAAGADPNGAGVRPVQEVESYLQ